MNLKMAWRNIWRNPRRTLLTVSAIAFASVLLVFMLSFQFGSYETMINSSVMILTGHLQIQAKGYQDKKSIHLVVPHPEAIAQGLKRIPQVRALSFRAEAFSLVSSKKRTYGAVVTGMDPAREKEVSRVRQLIRKGEYLSLVDREEALVGALLAKNLKVTVGDELTVLGQGRDGSIAAGVLRVKGIFSTGMDELDRSSLLIPLATFQELYAMDDAAHEIVVVARSLSEVGEAKRRISALISSLQTKVPLQVLDWDELMPGLRQGIEMDLISGVIFYLLLILVVAFSILNTFLMAILERTREFGVMLAIGATPRRLTQLVLMESMAMTAMGLLGGMIIGCLLTSYFQSHGIDVSGSSDLLSQFGISGRMYPRLSLLSVLSGPGAVFLITFFASLFPSLKVRRLRPVEAMNAV